MRLNQEEITVLKSKLYQLSSSAKLYLFGSRVDDSKKGGDKDLRIDFFKYFGEQKLDII